MENVGLTPLFGDAYAGRRVLVTGHTGFKGAWLTLWLQQLGADVAGFALPPDTSPSHWDLLDLKLATDVRADLRDASAVDAAVQAFSPDVVFHLAAQSLVRRSYGDPRTTFDVNVMGALNVFEAVRRCPSVRAVVNVTTDKVYENAGDGTAFTERDPLGGHDPYSASKACAEILSACYRRSFLAPDGGRVRLATARAGNVIGGGDWADDRLVPDMVRAVASGRPMQVRNPDATRPWQHVLEPLSGYLLLGQRLLDGRIDGGSWNFGPAPDSVLPVRAVVERLRREWPQLNVELASDRGPHEAPALSLDSGRAERELGWTPVWDAEHAIVHTADWYRRHADGRGACTREQLATYVADARAAKAAWT